MLSLSTELAKKKKRFKDTDNSKMTIGKRRIKGLNYLRKIPLQASILTKNGLIIKKQLKHTRKGYSRLYLYSLIII